MMRCSMLWESALTPSVEDLGLNASSREGSRAGQPPPSRTGTPQARRGTCKYESTFWVPYTLQALQEEIIP